MDGNRAGRILLGMAGSDQKGGPGGEARTARGSEREPGPQPAWERSREPQREPWMRGTHGELHPVLRAVVHALEQTDEDGTRWCAGLDETALFARPFGLPSVAFQLRHLARSLDRLLSYAEARSLDERQLALLHTEMDPGAAATVKKEFFDGLRSARERIARVDPATLPEARGIGRLQLPTTVAGLLIHCAEHTQRHTGQMVTTAKLVSAMARQGALAGDASE